jgi:hypothetical protein
MVLEAPGDRADGAVLIGALDDSAVDALARQRLAAGAPLDQKLELALLVEPADLARRIAGVVPDPVLIAVGQEDHRALAVSGFQAVGIELRLLLPLLGAVFGALCLDQAERLAVGAPEHIVDIADAMLVRHALDLEFDVLRPVEGPAGLLQQQVDEAVAGLGLVVVVGVGHRLVGAAGGSDLGAQALQLLVEVRLVPQERGQLAVLGLELLLLALDVEKGLADGVVAAGQMPGVEGQPIRRPIAAGIGAGEPEADMEQFLDRAGGIGGRDRSLLVHRAIAQPVDQLGLGEHRLARQLLEARLVQKCRDVVLIGQRQRRIVLERPFDGDLHRLAGIEGGCRRVGTGMSLRRQRRVVDGREFGGEKGEVRHGCPPAGLGQAASATARTSRCTPVSTCRA